MFAPLASAPHAQPGKTTLLVRRSLALVAGAALLGVAAQLPASAAPGDTAPGTTTANVAVGSTITLTGLTPSFTLTGVSSSTVEQDDQVSYRVTTANAGGYTVTVQAASAELTPAASGNPDAIPIANLKVRAEDNGAFVSLSNTSAVTLRNKATRSAAAGDAYADDYEVIIPFVASDTYSTALNYVATAS